MAWQTLCDEPLVLMRPGSGLRSLVDQAFARCGLRLAPVHEVSQVATALGLVAAGEGIAVLPSYAISRAQSTSQEQQLVTVPLVAPVVRREIVALTRVTDQIPAGCEGFIRHFKQVTGRA